MTCTVDLLPSSSPLKTFLVILSSFIRSNLFNNLFCFLLAKSRIPSWHGLYLKSSSSSCPLRSHLHFILVLSSVWLVLLTLAALTCSMFHIHASAQVTIVALMTFNLVFLLSSFFCTTASLLPPTILTAFPILYIKHTQQLHASHLIFIPASSIFSISCYSQVHFLYNLFLVGNSLPPPQSYLQYSFSSFHSEYFQIPFPAHATG